MKIDSKKRDKKKWPVFFDTPLKFLLLACLSKPWQCGFACILEECLSLLKKAIKCQNRLQCNGDYHDNSVLKRASWASGRVPKGLSCVAALHLEMWSIMCNGADENQAHHCDPYGLRVQEQPLFLVCSSITIFTSVGLGPYSSKNSDAGADQK